MSPGFTTFTTVKPGSVPVHPSGAPMTAGHATVFAVIENDSKRDNPGRRQGEPGQHRGILV